MYGTSKSFLMLKSIGEERSVPNWDQTLILRGQWGGGGANKTLTGLLWRRLAIVGVMSKFKQNKDLGVWNRVWNRRARYNTYVGTMLPI